MPFRKIVLAAGMLIVALTSGAEAANITSQNWGVTAKGEKAQLFTLKGMGGLEARITNYGGRVVNLLVPDAKGGKRDVVLGYDNLATYENINFFSALIGPFANKLGVTYKIAGQIYRQTQPVPAGRDSILHSGEIGFQQRMWDATMRDGPDPSLVLTIKDPDGLGGIPGNVTVTVTFTVRRDNALVIDYRGTTDKPTVMNLTDHFFFALQGEGAGDISNQILTIDARHDTNRTSDTVQSVEGTPYDFTSPVRLGDRLSLPQIGTGSTNMIIDGVPGQLRPAARLEDPGSGIVVDISTTQPAVQLYTDGVVAPITGKSGHVYRAHDAIALEPDHYPDSPNFPDYPSTEVTPDKPLHEVAEYRFSVKR